MKHELAATEAGKRIGFVLAGSPLHENDKNRSCSVECFAPLWRGTDSWWFSLQKGAAARQLNTHIVGDTNVFTLDPAIIMNLDLIVTVDTAVAHLAATLGKPVYLLLAFTPDWRWLLAREDAHGTQVLSCFGNKKLEIGVGFFQDLKRSSEKRPGQYEHPAFSMILIVWLLH